MACLPFTRDTARELHPRAQVRDTRDLHLLTRMYEVTRLDCRTRQVRPACLPWPSGDRGDGVRKMGGIPTYSRRCRVFPLIVRFALSFMSLINILVVKHGSNCVG